MDDSVAAIEEPCMYSFPANPWSVSTSSSVSIVGICFPSLKAAMSDDSEGR